MVGTTLVSSRHSRGSLEEEGELGSRVGIEGVKMVAKGQGKLKVT